MQMALDRNVEKAMLVMKHHITLTIDTNIRSLKENKC